MDNLLDLTHFFGGVYKDKRILVTGHTGFKGSWFVKWLEKLGAEVAGISLEPDTIPNHWNLISNKSEVFSNILDIRDYTLVDTVVRSFCPHLIFHLAAQPLVLQSYQNPLDTLKTNIIGTINVLEIARDCPELRGVCIITTDKCYFNQQTLVPYRETSKLGGRDPYSASKACAELITAAYRTSFFNTAQSTLIATCRGGNVIGGGDWAQNRLIPDAIRSISEKKILNIRSPKSIRPWQHILDCLSGYLLIGQKLLENDKIAADAWNIGPQEDDCRNVESVITQFGQRWPELSTINDCNPYPHEEFYINLDISKIKERYGWEPLWNLEKTIIETVDWYKQYYCNHKTLTELQIDKYCREGADRRMVWAFT